MAWTDPPAWAAGAILTAAQMNTNVRDNLKAIGDAWTAYTPAWTAATTNPSLGNGTLTGGRIIAGKLVIFRANLYAGSTTSFGSGQYAISLPVAAGAAGVQNILAEANIGGAVYRLMARVVAGGSTALLYCDPTTAGGAVRAVTNTVPATFANLSQISLNGVYEAA